MLELLPHTACERRPCFFFYIQYTTRKVNPPDVFGFSSRGIHNIKFYEYYRTVHGEPLLSCHDAVYSTRQYPQRDNAQRRRKQNVLLFYNNNSSDPPPSTFRLRFICLFFFFTFLRRTHATYAFVCIHDAGRSRENITTSLTLSSSARLTSSSSLYVMNILTLLRYYYCT